MAKVPDLRSLQTQWHPANNGDAVLDFARLGSNKQLWWLCEHKHEWQASVKNRLRGSGCPVCANRRVLTGWNDLATTHPELSSQWDTEKNTAILPTEVTSGSNNAVWWRCGLGHGWQASIKSRTQGAGCPVCSGRQALSGFNDLATTHPELAVEWHPFQNVATADQVTAGSNKKVWWQCAQGHEWEARTCDRTRTKATGCPVCSGSKVVAGVNDLATTHPTLALQWHPIANENLLPSHISMGSVKKVWWICSEKHSWQVSPNSRVSNNNGCPYCGKKKLLTGFNDLATLYPEIAAQWHPEKNDSLNPLTVTGHNGRKVWWLCAQGHEWQATVGDRTRPDGASGCPTCWNLNTTRLESEVSDWLKSLRYHVVCHDRSLIPPKEIDIYLPEHKFAIEFNGLYWHSEMAGKSKTYHQDKTTACMVQGITLFQVWEDDWRDKKDIVKKMILHRLGHSGERKVYARQTKVINLHSTAARAFLDEHHIQGFASGSLYLGLKDEATDQVVAVMVFKRQSSGVTYLERYATSCRVVGGFTKLLKNALRDLKPTQIITFADLSLSQGHLYEKTGFVVDSIQSPDYSYLVRDRRVHKFNYRLKRFRDDPTLQYEEGLSESQLAQLNRLNRIWDSGKIRYVLDLTS